MRATKILPFISILIITTLLAAPFIYAFTGGSFGGDAGGFDGGSFGGDAEGFSGGSYGGTSGGFTGGSFGGDTGGFTGGSYGGTDGGFNGGSHAGGSGSTGSFNGGSSFGGIPTSGFSPIPPGGFPPGGPGGFPPEADAVWQDLQDVTIYQGSSGRIIQENVFSKCSDPDSKELVFSIASTSANFDLAFAGDDLRLFNLNPSFLGTETITLTCNKIPESFLLHVISRGSPGPGNGDGDDESDGLSVHFSSIRIPEADKTASGELVAVYVSFKNNGDKKLENLKATVMIPDLGVRASIGPLDLSTNKRVSRPVYITLPDDVKPGEYTVRVNIDSGSVHRTKHRYVIVE